MTFVTATEMQNHFGKYLKIAQEEGEVVILKNGKEVARLVSKDRTLSLLTDQLVGIVDSDKDYKDFREERMKEYEKHQSTD